MKIKNMEEIYCEECKPLYEAFILILNLNGDNIIRLYLNIDQQYEDVFD